jgi:hypothetical protein
MSIIDQILYPGYLAKSCISLRLFFHGFLLIFVLYAGLLKAEYVPAVINVLRTVTI